MIRPVLHLFCGKIASGKSTLAATLAMQPQTVLLSEDEWLHALYSDEMTTGADFMRCSAKLRAAIGPHVSALLHSGVSVVLDFAANTVESRYWMRGLLDGADADHQLHVFDVPDELCLARLRARNTHGAHPFAVTEAQFKRFSAYFTLPTEQEGFTLVRHVHPSETPSPHSL